LSGTRDFADHSGLGFVRRMQLHVGFDGECFEESPTRTHVVLPPIISQKIYLFRPFSASGFRVLGCLAL
jgi:hypothetical protein